MKKMFFVSLFSALLGAAALAQRTTPFTPCKASTLTKEQVVAKGSKEGELKPVNYAKAPVNLQIIFIEVGNTILVNVSDNIVLQVFGNQYHYGDVLIANMPRVKGCKFEITTTKGKVYLNIDERAGRPCFHFSAAGNKMLNGASYSATLVLEKK